MVVAAAVVLVGIATVGAVIGTKSASEDITVSALFDNASPLVAGSQVRAAGVIVGEVTSIRLQHGRARVDMEVEPSVLPLHRDASAVITTQDLLGERYVNIKRGSPSTPLLGDPAVIPEQRTKRAVDLQEVLDAVDDPSGTSLAALVTTLGEGVHGQGPQVANTIRALAPAMRRTDELGGILDEQNSLLKRLVGNAEPVASSLAADRGQKLDQLVGSTTQTLGAVARNRQPVQESLHQLPDTLGKAQRTLSQVAGVADSATPMLASMRPVTDDLTNVSGELRRFADAADPALAAVPPVLKRADTMLDEARPLVSALRPAGPDLRGVAQSYRPLAEQALSTHLTDLMEFVKGWALSTADYDQLGHYFRASVPLTPKALGQVVGGPIPGAPDKPVPDLPVPAAPNLPLPGAGQDPIAKIIPGGSATGLTENQENGMLGQLLGGL
jgi:phospholipid/cholesterol/gamma-HCH transport system substrate-binding protein